MGTAKRFSVQLSFVAILAFFLSVSAQSCDRRKIERRGAIVPSNVVSVTPPVVKMPEAKSSEALSLPPAPATECRAAILVYHHVTPHVAGEGAALRAMTVAPASFERQMQYLHEHDYHVVPFGSVVDCISKGVALPDKAAVITIDDGWESPYVYALPILEKYGMIATFFVVTNMIGDGRVTLSWKQVKNLDDRGMTIGSHSMTHPFLTRVGNPAVLRNEIEGSRKALGAKLGKPVLYFAYPYGAVNQNVARATRDAGYAAARGVQDGTRHKPADLFNLKVVCVSDSLARFAKDIAQ